MKSFGTTIFCCFAVIALAAAQANPPSPSRAINDAVVVALPGQVHPLAKPQFDAGLANSSDGMERMILMLSLRPGADADLDYLIQQQHDPYSPLYHQWLTPDQFGAAFGISDADLNTIVWWLQQHGFTVDEVARGRRWINFTGTVGQVESAFHTEIHKYLVNGELHHANATPPSIPSALADLIVGFASLHDFYKRPFHGPVAAVAPDWTTGSSHYLGPGDFAAIYNVGPLYGLGTPIDGAGQTVAVVARSNINHSDPTTFRSFFKLPAKSPNYILNGADPGLVGGSLGGEVTEADLDAQWSGAIAYNATVDMVISKSTVSTDGVDLSAQYIINNNLAPIMTTSFGACEQDLGTSGNTFYANLWAQAATQGITPFVSSGDSGAAGCEVGGSSTGTVRAVNGLCSTPNSVCVGGTQFMDTSNPGLYWSSTNSGSTNSSALSYIPEQAWNESGSVSGGSGLWSTSGGASTVYPKPSWQVAPGVPADAARDVPDVSLSAAGHDGYLIYQAGGLYSVSGTSAASPSFASLMALVTQQQAGTRQGNANTIFYPMGNNQYAGSGGAAVFHDTTAGNNTVPGVTGYSAVTGFDLATGLGSVNVNNLVLNWGVPGFSVTPGSGSATVTQGNFVNLNINTAITNGFSAPMTLSASGLPSGVTASFSLNPMGAPGSGTSVLTLTASGGAAVGTPTITVTATGEAISHTTTFSLTVNPGAVVLPRSGWRLLYVDSQATDCGNYGATNSFDGNPGTMWVTEWCHSAPATPHEIQIDLGASYTISGFQYLPRQDPYPDGDIANYQFYVSTDGVNWGTAVSTGTLISSASDHTQKQVTFTGTIGRYIRLRAMSEVNGGSWTDIAELNVLGSAVATSGPQVASLTLSPASIAGGGTTSTATVTLTSAPLVNTTVTLASSNPAATVPATVTVNAGATSANFTITSASSVSTTTLSVINASFNGSTGAALLTVTPGVAPVVSTIPRSGWHVLYVDSQATDCGNYGAANAFDGNTTTMWVTEWCNSAPTTPHEMQIDLGARYNITGFTYLPRQDPYYSGNVKNYEFYVSSDGVNWGTAVATGTLMTSTADKSQKQVNFAAAAGRYVRFRAMTEINGGPWTNAAEINVLGTAAVSTIPTAGWRLLYVDSQATDCGNYGATNAFDGNSATMWVTEFCHGAPATPHEIQIDLGATYTISGFQYLPRQDQYSNGDIANYEFYVSADGTNWGTAVSSGTLITNPSDHSQKRVTFAGVDGRYVRLRALSEISGGPWTVVAELDVLGSVVAGSGLQVAGVMLTPESIAAGGNTSTALVTLTSTPSTDTSVTLSSSNPAAATVPGTVTVSAGTKSANFTVTSASAVGAAVTSVIGAALNGSSGTAILTVAPPSLPRIPQTGWHVVYVDSQATDCGNFGATNAIDGNPGTMWVTEFCHGAPATPHEIQIDLGATYTISGFQYLPRQDSYSNGNIANYEFYVSADGVNWGTAASTGTLIASASDHTQKQVNFAPTIGRYIRLRAMSEVNGGPWTNMAELNVLRTPAWSGVLAPSRAINWNTAGVTGGIPNRTTVCATIGPYNGPADAINTAIANCPSGQVVLLTAGTYNLTSGIVFANKSNVTLRGAGPDQTFLLFSAGGDCTGTGGADVCLMTAYTGNGGDQNYNNAASWTDGYFVGATSITLGSATAESIAALQVGSQIFLDQLDDASDPGSVYVCSAIGVCSTSGSSRNGRPGRGQVEPQIVTSISGTGPWTIGISPGIRMPNISAAKSPQAWWDNGLPIQNDGLENLTIDNTPNAACCTNDIFILNGLNNWIKNIRSVYAAQKHVWLYQTTHTTIRDSYFYGSAPTSDHYATDSFVGADNLIENNIFQHTGFPMMNEGCIGCVGAYNYAIDDYYTGTPVGSSPEWQQASSYQHSVGDAFVLWEGNAGIGMTSDDVHGTSNFGTAFRNYWNGRDMAGGSTGGKTLQTSAVILNTFNRFYNIVGNVLGTAGYHNTYTSAAPGGTSCDTSIYALGWGENCSSGAIADDTLVAATLMRWGNYDTVNNAVQFVSSEVPSGLAGFANPVPATQALPGSLYLNARPSWFGSVPWPPIGPDVSGGDNPNVGGHAYKIPAQLCYENTAKDANGILIAFNADHCY